LVQAVVDAIRENLIRPERRDDGHLVLDAADSVLAQVLLDGFDGVHLAISSVDLLRRPWERAIHVRTVRPARRGRRGKRALRSSGKAGPRSPSFLLKCGVIFDMPSTTGSYSGSHLAGFESCAIYRPANSGKFTRHAIHTSAEQPFETAGECFSFIILNATKLLAAS
jgi:hypothetical protein